MADNLQSGMATPLLVPGMRIVVEALDPTSGADVSGVLISNVVISGDPDGDADGTIGPIGPFMLVPGPAPVGNAGDGATVKGGL